MSKFDIMRAVVDGAMKAPPVPLDSKPSHPKKTSPTNKAKVAMVSAEFRALKVTERTDWFSLFEQRTGQV